MIPSSSRQSPFVLVMVFDRVIHGCRDWHPAMSDGCMLPRLGVTTSTGASGFAAISGGGNAASAALAEET